MMDHEKIKQGVRLMLQGIGEDVNREGLQDTPDRIARMCEQIYGGLYEDAAVHLSKQFHATCNNTPCVNTTFFPFMARPMWRIFRMAPWLD